ncbi:excisionase [Escherichia coli]|uniref:excisionase n=1 Tax=Escherichia coli TaxID=562 RepID=UPI0019D28E93|nr:excisionase [Escherichia coli]MBN6673567.1 excisionase [Escherichia coli]
MYLTLQEWNARQRRPRSLETVRRWVRECRIFPPPVKDGREYLFHESAVKVDLRKVRISHQTQKNAYVSD